MGNDRKIPDMFDFRQAITSLFTYVILTYLIDTYKKRHSFEKETPFEIGGYFTVL